jgi:hypothetical protein
MQTYRGLICIIVRVGFTNPVRSRSVVDGAESYIGLGRERVPTFAIGHDLGAECEQRDDVCGEDEMHVDHS